ncbi:lipocalin family protein [Flavobacterium plurextorum]|uniref:lipocalin family protein n=1 Tax=Flavobacterium TaxID=237 RepID=UPI00214D87C9|nr:MULTISPECIES: lipocalin family protein [Flavobacterium]UUW11055.1 lipocalin family protein [Flavobacterium plurextorum]
MKTTLSVILFFFMCTISAQTSTQLIGKWQLVKLTKNGKEKSIKEKFKSDQVFQVFSEDGKFMGIVGDKSTKGKWKLSKNNEVLTVVVDLISVKFQIEYFDSEKRIITNDQLGTLEYKKVN